MGFRCPVTGILTKPIFILAGLKTCEKLSFSRTMAALLGFRSAEALSKFPKVIVVLPSCRDEAEPRKNVAGPSWISISKPSNVDQVVSEKATPGRIFR
jgi:hypothetical protein